MKFSIPHFAILFSLLLSGCLPHGCQREEFTELAPADSVSRYIAQETPRDTLAHVWSTTGSDTGAAEATLEFPRTVRFGPNGQLFVSDVERNSVFAFTPEGRFVHEITDDAFDVPYLAGIRADTLVVLNAGTDRLAFVHGDRVVREVPIDADQEGRALLYAAATDTALYTKVVDDAGNSFVARLNRHGGVASRVPLPGPDWRHAGMLRAWGDSLLSLSGFRPVVDVLPLSMPDTAVVDSMALLGFDSPMLARSYAYLTGETSTAPLLTTAAAPLGDRLFVLNLRPGWLQVDTYDHEGQLHRRLVESDSTYQQRFYPRDLAVQRRQRGYDIAVVLTDPEPRLDLYRWTPDRP